MFKNILVPVLGSKNDVAALELARLIGCMFDARLECLHVRAGAAQIIARAAIAQFGTTMSTTELLRWLEKEAQSAQTTARETYDAFRRTCEADRPGNLKTKGVHGVVLQWEECEGDSLPETISRARFDDLLILGRAPEHGLSARGIGSILLGSGRPAMLAGSEGCEDVRSTVVIAWKETPEAARAVTAAMPLLEKADRIVVLSVDEHENHGDAGHSARRLGDRLRHYGWTVDAQAVRDVDRSGPEALLHAAYELHASCLVMGAYSHSRARELVFGGFTQHVLKSCPFPVLLCH